MIHISGDKRLTIRGYVVGFRDNFVSSVIGIIAHQIPLFSKTGELEEFVAALDLLIDACTTKSADAPLNIDKISVLLPYLKRVVLTRRRDEATVIDWEKSKTHNPDILKSLEDRLKPLDYLLNEPWLRDIEPVKVPRLIEYLSIQQIENHYHPQSTLAEREYDEKFHILQAPRLFFSDLHYYRRKCEIRGAGIVVAYLDIDDFKNKFNKIYGEVETDRRVLPRFMQALDKHIYSHGFAYRYGGDEYVLLLPNMPIDLAVKFLDLLRTNVAALKYRDVKNSTTISIGFCHADSDCFLTDREIEERANKAKNFAKENGKNCIATYKGARYLDNDLHIISPIS